MEERASEPEADKLLIVYLRKPACFHGVSECFCEENIHTCILKKFYPQLKILRVFGKCTDQQKESTIQIYRCTLKLSVLEQKELNDT